MAQPPFLLTYYNPFSDDPKKNSLVRSYIDYVKNTSLAKYSADVVGSYLEETSSSQLAATESIGRAICGELYDGFSSLQTQLKQTDLRQAKQLGEISGGIRQISSDLRQVFGALEGVNQRLDLMRDEIKTSNVLLENIGELLRISDSQKQRQHHIELALKFLKNAQKDQDLYQDALNYLLKAEKVEKEDYFVLHRIGMIYLYAPNLINLEKALDYFTRAAKYAAVESDPGAARLSNVLNKQVTEKFADQAESLPDKKSSDKTAESFEHSILALAAESYFQAGSALYALGRFVEAVKMVEKAVAMKNGESKYHFFCAKYLIRSGKHEDAVRQLLKAIEIAPEMAMAAVGDYDLNRSKDVLAALQKLDKEMVDILNNALTSFKEFPVNDWDETRSKVLPQWIKQVEVALATGNYAGRVRLWQGDVQYETDDADWNGSSYAYQLDAVRKLREIDAFGVEYDKNEAEMAFLEEAEGHEIVYKWLLDIWKDRRSKVGAVINSTLNEIAKKPDLSYNELVLLTTADKTCFAEIGALKWKAESDTIPAVGEDGMVYIGLNNCLIALDKETGRETWRFNALGWVGEPIVGGYIVFFNDTQQIYALDGRTGRKIWTQDTRGKVRLLAGDGTVFASTYTSIYAIAGNSGKVLWTQDLPEGSDGFIAAGSIGTIVVSGKNKLIAFNSKTGWMLWNIWLANENTTQEFVGVISLAYDHTNNNVYCAFSLCKHEDIYIGANDRNHEYDYHREKERYQYCVTCINGETGNKLWNQNVIDKLSIRLNNGFQLAIDSRDHLYCVWDHGLETVWSSTGKTIDWQESDWAVVDKIMALPPKTRVMILAPVVRQQKGEFRDVFERLAREGFVRVRVDGELLELGEEAARIRLDKKKFHNIEAVVDRLVIDEKIRERLGGSVQTALRLGEGVMFTLHKLESESNEWIETLYCKNDLPATITPMSSASSLFSNKKISGITIGFDKAYLVTCNEPDKTQLYSIDIPRNTLQEHTYIPADIGGSWGKTIIDNSGVIYVHSNNLLYAIYATSSEAVTEAGTIAPWPMYRQNPQGTGCAVKPQFRIPTQEEIDREVAALAEKKKDEERKRLEIEAAEKARKEEEKRIESEKAEIVRKKNVASHFLEKATAAENTEKAKWFRKKDFSSALELYRKAAAAGSTEATAKVEELTKLIAVK